MIHTASYKRPETHHGELINISLRKPRGFKVDGDLDFFKPTQQLLDNWKKSAQDDAAWAEYEKGFWALMGDRREVIQSWFKGLSHHEIPHMTLLCHEETDKYCHRRLVALAIQKYRPDLWGGRDTRALQVGDWVEWALLPPHFEPVCGKQLRINAIESGEARVDWIRFGISLSELRLTA